MEGIDKEYGAAWVDTFSAAFRAGDSATTSEMLSDLSGGGRLVSAFHTDTCEFLDEIVNGLHRLNVAVPANVTAAHGIYKSLVTERAPLTRRAKLFIIGGAVVAAAAYVYHRYRRTAKRADELEAIRSLLAGDSAVSLDDDAAVTPQHRTSRPSAKERSKVMDRNKKLMARSRAGLSPTTTSPSSSDRCSSIGTRIYPARAPHAPHVCQYDH